MNHTNRHGLILAGGLGERLWPKSRKHLPKQFLDFGTGETLVQKTFSRIETLIPPERIWVITRPEHKDIILEQIPRLAKDNLILEPCPKGTAAAVAWSVKIIEKSDSSAVISVFPSDHFIGDETIFRKSMDAALLWAEQSSDLVTLGIKPSRAETEYGYIEPGHERAQINGYRCFRVKLFHEKPDKETAARYCSSGKLLWNSGIFMFGAKPFLKCLERSSPNLFRLVNEMAPHIGRHYTVQMKYYRHMPDTSLDKEVIEKSACVTVFPVSFQWHDMGLWQTHYELAEKDENGNAIDQGKVVEIDCSNNLFMSKNGSLVAAIGIDNMAVIANGNVILVCPRERLQEIKDMIKELKKRELDEYI